MFTGLTVTKTANKMVWSGGNLMYSIEVNNQTEMVYTSPVITDILNPNLIKLVENTIKVDGTLLEASQYNYEEDSGKLTINLPNIEATTKKTVTFEVSKK